MAAASVHITKLAAAQRQLRAAIRLFFAAEDELAVHTVASAAYRLIADLKADRGLDEVADYYLTSVFYVVRDFRRGTLPRHFTEDPEVMKWVHDMAERLPISKDSSVEEVRVSVSAETARGWWLQRNRIANFLKHADRDARAHIALGEINNLELLLLAISSYGDLVKDDLGAEGLILWIYHRATSGTTSDLSDRYREIAQAIGELHSAERLRFCADAIVRLNATQETHGPCT